MVQRVLIVDDEPNIVVSIEFLMRQRGYETCVASDGQMALDEVERFQPDLVKIDMELIRGIATSAARQAIIRGILAIARDLDLKVIAEGIETEDELRALRLRLGNTLQCTFSTTTWRCPHGASRNGSQNTPPTIQLFLPSHPGA